MITVSNAWKEAHKQTLLPETFVEISLDIVATPSSVTVSATNEATFSNSSVIVNSAGGDLNAKYAVLEHNLWVLDGSNYLADGSETASGYVSANVSGSEDVEITLGEVSRKLIPGITITWSRDYETYAKNFSIAVKGEFGNTFAVTNRSNTSNVTVVDLPISDYKSLVITVNEWSHPDQRVRIDSVKLGHSLVFGKNEIISYSHEQIGSPLGTELTKNSIEFEVDNSDGRWNPLNPAGLEKYLSERQKLVVRYGQQTNSGVEWIQAGVFYLTEWKAPSSGITATFVARDAIEFMLNTTYSRSHITGVTTGDLGVYSTKDGVVTPNGEQYTGELLTTIPSGTEIKIYEESFQYAKYDDDPDGSGWPVLRIEQGWVYPFYVSYTGPNLKSDVLAAFESCLPDDIQVIDLSENISAPTSISEQTIAELAQCCCASGASTMWQDRNGNIVWRLPLVYSGTDYVISSNVSYSHPEVELAKPLREVNVIYRYQNNESATKVKTFHVNDTGDSVTIDAPYVWNDMNDIQRVADAYIAWWKHREVVSGEFRADPRLELFDCVEVETKYGVLSPVMITYLKYTYNGAFRAMYEGKVVDASINQYALEV